MALVREENKDVLNTPGVSAEISAACGDHNLKRKRPLANRAGCNTALPWACSELVSCQTFVMFFPYPAHGICIHASSEYDGTGVYEHNRVLVGDGDCWHGVWVMF